MLNTSYLGIGTNKGNRTKNIEDALNLLRQIKEINILKVSDMFHNPPREGIKTGDFLNGAIKITTTLTPVELLNVCKDIERKMGREPISSNVNHPRIIDLDILFYGDEVISTDSLTIPHPMIEKRDFVLIPLNEIASDFLHPVLKKTIGELSKAYAPISIKN